MNNHGQSMFLIISWHMSHLFYPRLLQCLSWAQMAMHADDQLRQRQSWALSQIIAVGLPGSGMVFYEVGQFCVSAMSLFFFAVNSIILYLYSVSNFRLMNLIHLSMTNMYEMDLDRTENCSKICHLT